MIDHAARLRGAVKKETYGDLAVLTPAMNHAFIAK
jgi:hypothetical protein